MTVEQLVEYLHTQNPYGEVTVFDGHSVYQIDNIHDSELQISIHKDEED